MNWSFHILTLLLLFTLFRIAWQDFKNREVSVSSLAILSGLLLYNTFRSQSLDMLLVNTVSSLLFLAIQALVVFLYFFIRNNMRAEKVGFSDLIGGADIWMILILVIAFNWIVFVFFITASTIVALIAYAVLKVTGKSKDERIPLAGVFSVLYMVVLIACRVFHVFDPYYPFGFTDGAIIY